MKSIYRLHSRGVFAACVLVFCVLAPKLLQADSITVYTNTAGATPSADRTATFTSLSTGTSLANYTEGGLAFSMGTQSDYTLFTPAPGGFSGGFLYGGGSFTPLTISTTDASTLYGVQFDVGSGYGGDMSSGATLYFAYELFRGATVVGSGNLSVVQTASGYLLGIGDTSGFASMEITNCVSGPCALTMENAIAIDNVTADVTAPASVPEPASLVLLGSVLLALSMALKRKFASA